MLGVLDISELDGAGERLSLKTRVTGFFRLKKPSRSSSPSLSSDASAVTKQATVGALVGIDYGSKCPLEQA